MSQKRLLMLGGSMQQIPAIRRAKELGHYVITCDYLPDNPGHALADEYHNVSTTDREAVLRLARELSVDGILAYASDPAAPTAAYVAEKLGLPGDNPLESVEVLTQKDRFRAFLARYGFNTPRARGYSSAEAAAADVGLFALPLMVKPVDSSGSKGVVKVERLEDFEVAVQEAFSYSRSGRIVIEEFIQKRGYQISGDGFSVDGRLVFTSYGNELYGGKGVRDYVALGEFWPSLHSDEDLARLDDELQRLITALSMGTAAYNIEAIVDERGDIYLIELGPRNGGSYIPQLISHATGVDLVDYAIKGALGEDCSSLGRAETRCCVSNYMILSTESGRFVGLWFDDRFKKNNLMEVYCTCEPGEPVEAYRNTSHSLGTILFKASNVDEMRAITDDIDRYVRVLVDRDGDGKD